MFQNQFNFERIKFEQTFIKFQIFLITLNQNVINEYNRFFNIVRIIFFILFLNDFAFFFYSR